MRLGQRATMLLASLALGAVAAIATVVYVRGVQARALDGAEPVDVYVAIEEIPAGTTAGEAQARGLFEQRKLPRTAVGEGAVVSIEDVRDKMAVAPILKGEPLRVARFGTGAAVNRVLPIASDRQAMSLEVGVPPGVGGFIQPGDHIAIVAQLDVPRAGGAQPEPRVAYLLQDVPVLSVGRRVVTDKTEGKAEVDQQQKVLLTLALRPAEVEKLTFAVFQGQVYATLLPPDAKPAATSGRTRDNAFAQ